jgi:hypothetical protein
MKKRQRVEESNDLLAGKPAPDVDAAKRRPAKKAKRALCPPPPA